MRIRRGLPLVPLLPALLGPELATGMVTGSLGLMARTERDFVAGDRPAIPVQAYLGGLVLLGAGAAGLLPAGWMRWGDVSVGKGCPCGRSETVRVRRGRRHRLLARLREEMLQRRRCGARGWTGLTRVN